jgi:uncharacterized protein
MTSTSTLEKLRTLAPELRRKGVESLFVFGSMARGDNHAGSDIDLFFEAAPSAKLSLVDIIGIRHFLEDVLGAPVDLMTRDSLHPLLRDDIEAEAISVF